MFVGFLSLLSTTKRNRYRLFSTHRRLKPVTRCDDNMYALYEIIKFNEIIRIISLRNL